MTHFPDSISEDINLNNFRNPCSAYRGAPFWAWNTKISKEILDKELPIFRNMGFGGYHIHPRTGLDTKYLSDDFMQMVKYCAEYAKKNNLKCYAYDEDRFPSGSAGGYVTKNIKYRQRQLIWTRTYNPEYDIEVNNKRDSSYYIGKYEIELDNEGYLSSYKKLENYESVGSRLIRYALLKIAPNEPWFNGYSYVDTLYKPAIDEFIRCTHKRYYDKLGKYFGDIIPSFFTDEPKVAYKRMLDTPEDVSDIVMPWTDDYPNTFKEAYNFNIIDYIPELFYEKKEGFSKARYYYHRHILDRFCFSFCENISDFCNKHGVRLTGHMVKEPKLSSQAISAGEVMAPLSYFGWPGIDMLCDAREYTTAKQAQSVKDQFGRDNMLSELYGVTNWDFDFRGHKLAGDWQAALGVNLRVPHLAWMSMKGESKRDYPASIFYQSPWYKRYSIIEDHFARVNTCLTRGQRVCKIAMIHPVESAWLYYGVKSMKKEKLKQLDKDFKDLTKNILFDNIDFDYISEFLMQKQPVTFTETGLKLGYMTYNLIIVPGCVSLRNSTKKILDEFRNRGGRVIIYKSYPLLIDGNALDRSVFEGYEYIDSYRMLLKILDDYRDFEIKYEEDDHSNYLVQHRKDGDNHWFFIAGAENSAGDSELTHIVFRIKSILEPYIFDTITGNINKAVFFEEDGYKNIRLTLYKHDSIMLELRKTLISEIDISKDNLLSENSRNNDYIFYFEVNSKDEFVLEKTHTIPISLSESNCLILDEAQYYINNKKDEIHEKDQVLRINDRVKDELGIDKGGPKPAQPWTITEKKSIDTVTLIYTVESDKNIFGAELALEDVEQADISINGKNIIKEINGYYVDNDISKILIPPLLKGINTIEIKYPVKETNYIEAVYLLGDFGVFKRNTGYYLSDMPESIKFGNITTQGLPFYGGNITYYLYLETSESDIILQVASYKGAMIEVELDGKQAGNIIFDPYCIDLNLSEGRHVIGLKLYGNRVNTFGTLHNTVQPLKWVGPEAFRTVDHFTYDYVLKEFGILAVPKIKNNTKKIKEKISNE